MKTVSDLSGVVEGALRDAVDAEGRWLTSKPPNGKLRKEYESKVQRLYFILSAEQFAVGRVAKG